MTPHQIALPRLDKARLVKRVDDIPVWSISCFYVRKGYRKRGVTTALIEAAVKAAKRAKAPALEAYPMDTNETKSSSSIYTGRASTFTRAGFKVIARHAVHRPIMRIEL
jgi:GNAT superfamily N-acetyltransferase